jgi:hypothetical protein
MIEEGGGHWAEHCGARIKRGLRVSNIATLSRNVDCLSLNDENNTYYSLYHC